MIKKIVITLLLLFGVLIIFIGFAYSQKERLAEILFKEWINRSKSPVLVSRLDIDAITFSSEGQLSVDGLSCQGSIDGKEVEGTLNRISVKSLPNENVVAEFEGLELEFEDWIVLQGQGDIVFEPKGESLSGVLRVGSIAYGEYEIEDGICKLQGDLAKITCRPLTANLYQGAVQGYFSLELRPEIYYSYSLVIDHLNANALAHDFPLIKQYIKGDLSGTIDMSGNVSGITNLDTSWSLSEGGEIESTLIEQVIALLPQDKKKDALTEMMGNKGFVPFEQATIELQGISKESISSGINLKSRKINLDADISLDVNVEGGLGNLTKYIGLLPGS